MALHTLEDSVDNYCYQRPLCRFHLTSSCQFSSVMLALHEHLNMETEIGCT